MDYGLTFQDPRQGEDDFYEISAVSRTNFLPEFPHDAHAAPFAQHEAHRGLLERAVHATAAQQRLRAAAAAAEDPAFPQLTSVGFVRPAKEEEAEAAEEAFAGAGASDHLRGASCRGEKGKWKLLQGVTL